MLGQCHPLWKKKIEKWRISSFANFVYTKMKNSALASNSTHWIHQEGLNVILLPKRLKCIGVSQTDIGHWLHLEEGIILLLKRSTESILYPKPVLLPHQAWSQTALLTGERLWSSSELGFLKQRDSKVMEKEKYFIYLRSVVQRIFQRRKKMKRNIKNAVYLLLA